MNKYKLLISILLLFTIMVSIIEPLKVSANNAEKSHTIMLDVRNIGSYVNTIYDLEIDVPKDFGELVNYTFNHVEPSTTENIESVDYDSNRNKLKIKFEMGAGKVAEVNGYRDNSERLFQGTPYNAVCRYSDGVRWQLNETTRKDTTNQKFITVYRIEDLNTSTTTTLPTQFVFNKYRVTGDLLLAYNTQSVGYWVDSKGNTYTNAQIETSTKHVKQSSISFPKGMKQSKVDFQFYHEKYKPYFAYEYETVTPGSVLNSLGVESTDLVESDDASVQMTGHAKCYRYTNQVEYYLSAKTIPSSHVIGTFTFRYKTTEEPKIIATIEANPAQTKFDGNNVTVNVTLKTELVNVKPGAVIDYKLYLRTEDQSQNPNPEGYKRDGKTLKAEVTEQFTIPASKLNNIDEFTEYFVGRAYAYLSSGGPNHTLMSDLVKTSSLVYKNSPVVEDTTNHEIAAFIQGNRAVKLGDDTTFSAYGSYSTNSTIEGYRWELPFAMVQPSGAYEAGQTTFTTWYNTVGTQRAVVYVIDKEGRQAGAFMDFEVVEPTIEVSIGQSGTLKENRKVTFNANISTPTRYPVSKIKWNVESLSGNNQHIKHQANLEDLRTFDALFKIAGEYLITVDVENTAGYKNQATYVIEIVEDKKPVADFEFQNNVYRDPSNSNKATFELTDKSYSFDGDYIKERKWYVIFDANNDGIFNEARVLFNSGNNKEVTYQNSHVGKYRFILEVTEEFGEPTIASYVTASDRRKTLSDER